MLALPAMSMLVSIFLIRGAYTGNRAVSAAPMIKRTIWTRITVWAVATKMFLPVGLMGLSSLVSAAVILPP